MGIDALDIQFRLEKCTGHKFARGEWDTLSSFAMKRQPPDVTVGEFFNWAVSKGRPAGAARCVKCRYRLHGLPTSGRCPECGLGYEQHALNFEELQEILSKALGILPNKIREESLLIKDLGMS